MYLLQFLGLGSFLRDKDSFIDMRVSTSREINNVKLSGGYMRGLYASADPSVEQYNNGMPSEWVYDTSTGGAVSVTTMLAKFNGTCNASPSEIDVQNINYIRIKRRIKGSSQKWITIYEKAIDAVADLTFEIKDYLCRNNCTYEYNIVSVVNGSETYTNNIIEVYSSFDGIYLTNGKEQYGTYLDTKCDYSRKTSSSTVQPINSRYPVSIKNGYVNYSSGSVTGRLLKMDENCEPDLDGNYQYRKNAVDFLSENETLVFKNYDGFIAIVSIGDEISESFEDVPLSPKISFSWEQIGDADNYNDLKDNGLIGGVE